MITRIFGAVTGGRLNLRVAADTSASVLASIPDETLLIVAEYNDTWYATTYGANIGFVMKQYITLLDLPNVTEQAGICPCRQSATRWGEHHHGEKDYSFVPMAMRQIFIKKIEISESS